MRCRSLCVFQAVASAIIISLAEAVDCDNLELCSDADEPVCGSDGATYNNKCEFEIAFCMDPRDGFTMTPGACELEVDLDLETDIPTSTEEYEPTSSTVTIVGVDDGAATTPLPAPQVIAPEEDPSLVSMAEAFCDLTCKMTSDPVCGSDGETYINDCHLLAAKCEHPEVYKVGHGECPSNDSTTSSSLSSESSATESSEASAMSMSSASAESSTSSGSSGSSSPPVSSSPDLTTGDAVDVEVSSQGNILGTGSNHRLGGDESFVFTDSHHEINEDDLITNDGDELAILLAESVPIKCNPMCPRNYDPVCGSNGKTYANDCLLAYGMCRDPKLFKFSEGKCPPSLVAAQDASAFGSICVPSPCAHIDAPLCGSDGLTHANPCMFANARCHHPRLTVVHDGPCGSETVLTCATMTCSAFTECKEEGGEGDDDPIVAYCADVCAPERCGELEKCELVDSECFTAPCSPVAMCVPKYTATTDLVD